MRKVIDAFQRAIYPFLITLFIYCYTQTNLRGFDYQALMMAEVFLMLIFAILSMIGFVWNILYTIKNKN